MGKLDPAAPGGVEYYEALKKKLILKACSIGWIFRGFGHSGTNIPGYAAGLQFLFARPSLNLPPQSLQNLPGLRTGYRAGKVLNCKWVRITCKWFWGMR